MTVKKMAVVILSALTGTVLAFLLNFLILDKLLIPNPCYCHSHDTNKVFDIFYELTSSEGYRPFPTKFNFIFTTTIGAIFGLTLSIYKLRKYYERKITNR